MKILPLLLVVACAKKSTQTESPAEKIEPKVWIEEGLPTAESAIDSFTVTVSANDRATAYQYAFFADPSLNCATATYGEFKPLSTPLTETVSQEGAQILCLRGRDNTGTLQSEPERYSWTKVPSIALSETVPEAVLAVEPATGDTQIKSIVTGNGLTTSYQYALFEQADYDCATANNYLSKPLSEELVLELGSDGNKTLCLRGVAADGKIQPTATRYSWRKDTGSNLVSEDDNGRARLEVLNPVLQLISGSLSAYGMTVRNTGQGTLRWRVDSASSAPWLETGSLVTSYRPVTIGKITSGTLEAGESGRVHFRGSKGRNTDYGQPFTRELALTVVNEDSNFKIKAKVILRIPKLDIETEQITLVADSQPTVIPIDNLNPYPDRNPLKIEMVAVFPPLLHLSKKRANIAKFNNMVTTKISPHAGDKDLKFTITDKKAVGCKVWSQTFLVYSNGDSTGAGNCKIEAGKRYIGRDNNASWNTTRCKKIIVSFNDLNNDGQLNVLDLTKVSAEIGEPPQPMTRSYRRADVDGNGKVDQADLEALSKCFN